MSINTVWHLGHITKKQRAESLKQTPSCIWLTGLSGSGKSTLANEIELQLHKTGHHVYVLDGDNVRHGLNCDLTFSETDRVENIRRVAEVAHLMVDAGLIVVVAFISPFRSDRKKARDLFNPNEFIEVFVDTPLAICEQRDVKGFYKKARNGEIKDFTGINSPYEKPENPEIHLDMNVDSIENHTKNIIAVLTNSCL